jgi:sigma-B regulation protein RsbU (phosphoserine phosphatase)
MLKPLAAVDTSAHRVLVVDDTEEMRLLYSHVLRAEGYQVSVAVNGKAALAALEGEPPDLILLDHMMPGMSGAEVLKKIRQDPRLADIPTVFLTASTLDITEALDLGATDFFAKPINRRILVARVRAMITNHRSRRTAQDTDALTRDRDRLLEEVLEAQKLQQAQLPATPVRWGGWAAGAALTPCNNVGGDVFDIVRGPNDERTIALIDVSGHGLASALVASGMRSMLHYLLADLPIDRVASELNRRLCDGADSYYACLALLQTEGDVVHIVNAGLPPVVVITDRKVTAQAAASGSPPGLIDGATYEVHSFRLSPGMRVVLASDGLTEPFGQIDQTGTFLEALGLTGDRYADEASARTSLPERVRRLFADTGRTQDDDATVVVLERSAST